MDGFHEFAAHCGARIDQLSAADAIELMGAFYREVRADDCNLDADGDMLLFQWGLSDWGDGASFAYDITRQLIPQAASDDAELSSFIGQLSLTLKFPSSAELEEIMAGNEWCCRPSELVNFLAVISGCSATSPRYGNAE